jgi:hypothetical protein
VRAVSGSFALERRAQDDGKNKQQRRTGNGGEQATARANAGILRCAQNDKQEEARATATARANTEILAAPE